VNAAAPRVILGSWPTPLEPAPRLARALGLRDDGTDVLVTTGGPQRNHARLTAAGAEELLERP
jgi:L-cysteate sulfo-lyase